MKRKFIILTEQQIENLFNSDVTREKFQKELSSLFDPEEIKKYIQQNKGVKSPGQLLYGLKNLEKKRGEEDVKQLPTKKLQPVKSQTDFVSTGAGADFQNIIQKIIDRLEGGYYHPNMKAKNPSKFARMGGSGETMYGMDRKHGNQEATAAGREFWSLIDKENASQRWSYNYKLEDNPGLASKLKNLIAQIMKPNFDKYVNSYFSDEAKKIVMANPKLYANYVYATYNGPVRFKKWAAALNDKVASGVTDPAVLEKFVVDLRKNSGNSILASTASKVQNLMNDIA